MVWASWETREGFRFKIPFTSFCQADHWLRARRLLDHATLEWDNGRRIRLSGTLNRGKLKPGARRLAAPFRADKAAL